MYFPQIYYDTPPFNLSGKIQMTLQGLVQIPSFYGKVFDLQAERVTPSVLSEHFVYILVSSQVSRSKS